MSWLRDVSNQGKRADYVLDTLAETRQLLKAYKEAYGDTQTALSKKTDELVERLTALLRNPV